MHIDIIAQQFKDLMSGDRYFYENTQDPNTRFTTEQIDSIQKVFISTLICENLDVNVVPRNPWFVPSNTNPTLPCSIFPHLNLTLWKEF